MTANNPGLDRTSLTFSQAEGLEPLPEPLKLGELSREARSLLWRVFHDSLAGSVARHSSSVGYDWGVVLSGWHVEVLHKPVDEFSKNLKFVTAGVKEFIFAAPWNQVFDFLTYVMRHKNCPRVVGSKIDKCLSESRAAYLVALHPPTIMPRATEPEGAAIIEALTALRSTGLDGARTHLLQAGERLNQGDYADTVRESIHAVESVARELDPQASHTLAPALRALEGQMAVHPALREGFSKIYGYTNDEGGIRHALLEREAQFNLEDAVFMIGACASFTSYLVGKARKAGLISE